MFARKRLEIITGGVFLSITLLLCVFGWLSYRNYETYRTAQERIARVSEQLRALNVTVATLQEAETGQRGYLLTRNPAYLEPYTRAVSSVAANLVWLRKSFVSERQFDDELDAIERLKRSKFAELERTIALAGAGKIDAALQIVNSDHGKQTMDQIRTTVWAMILAKRKELAAIQAESIKGTRDAERATIGFGLAIGMFLLAAYGYLIYDLRDRRRLRSSGRSTDSLDLLTGAYNSGYLSRALATSVKYADRDRNPIALIMIQVRISAEAQDAAADKHALVVTAANQLAAVKDILGQVEVPLTNDLSYVATLMVMLESCRSYIISFCSIHFGPWYTHVDNRGLGTWAWWAKYRHTMYYYILPQN